MQKKTLGMLAVLLVAQLLLAAAMSFTGRNPAAVKPDTPLVDLGGHSVDRLVLQGDDKQQLVLARQGDGWVLPDTGNFPADSARVGQLLDRLQALKRGFAVATTAGAQARFKVSDDDYKLRVQLEQDDKTLATVYFGTSPGLRQVHARTAGDDAVYTADFGLFEAPLKASDWEDKRVLHLSADEIDRIDLGGVTLERAPVKSGGASTQGGDRPEKATVGWHGDGLGEGESLKQAAATTLVQKLSGLDIGSVLGTDAKPDYGLKKPALVINVRRHNGKTIEYRLGKRDQQHDYVLKLSSRPEYFRLPVFIGDELVKAAQRDRLVVATAAPGKAPTGDSPVATAPPAAGTSVQGTEGGTL